MNPLDQCKPLPIRLKALEIGGIGSYLKTARLEFRPLTILCGTNGGGKSTWLRVIDLLRDSVKSNSIPFPFELHDDLKNTDAQSEIFAKATDSLINALLQYRDQLSSHVLEAFKQAGLDLAAVQPRIAVELEVLQDCSFSDSGIRANLTDPPRQEQMAAFIHFGKCAKGGIIKLELSCFEAFEDHHAYGVKKIGIYYDGNEVLSLAADPHQSEPGRRVTPLYYQLTSPSFPGAEIRVKRSLESADLECAQDQASGENLKLLDFGNLALQRIAMAMQTVFTGTFHLESMRKRFKKLTRRNDSHESMTRDVGGTGEYAMWLLLDYRYNVMRQPHRPWFGYVDQQPFIYQIIGDEDRIMPEFGVHSKDPFPLFYLNWLLRLASVSERNRLEQLYQEARGGATRTEALDDNHLHHLAMSIGKTIKEIMTRLVAEENLSEKVSAEHWPAEAGELLAIGWSKLLPIERQRVNRLILDQLSANACDNEDIGGENERLVMKGFWGTDSGLDFVTYVSIWLRKLTGVEIYDAAKWVDSEAVPVAFLQICRPFANIRSLNHLKIYDESDQYCEDSVIFHNAFMPYALPDEIFPGFLYGPRGNVSTPNSHSSAFHQLLPIIVQTGLLKRFELFAVENPEVHLHPKLQLEVTAFFIEHAKVSKFFLIETHSDLVVRRVLRAILEEDIPQSFVKIYFARPEKLADYETSVLEPIAVDDLGRISNWPEGFMDADIAESRLLMRVMYGNVGKERETEQENR